MTERSAGSPLLEPLQAVFDALADPTRRKLIERLVKEGPASMTELAAEFPITRQAISKHMAVLEHAGLLESEWRGRERRLTFTPAPLDEAARWIARIESEWDARLDALKQYLLSNSQSD